MQVNWHFEGLVGHRRVYQKIRREKVSETWFSKGKKYSKWTWWVLEEKWRMPFACRLDKWLLREHCAHTVRLLKNVHYTLLTAPSPEGPPSTLHFERALGGQIPRPKLGSGSHPGAIGAIDTTNTLIRCHPPHRDPSGVIGCPRAYQFVNDAMRSWSYAKGTFEISLLQTPCLSAEWRQTRRPSLRIGPLARLETHH